MFWTKSFGVRDKPFLSEKEEDTVEEMTQAVKMLRRTMKKEMDAPLFMGSFNDWEIPTKMLPLKMYTSVIDK